MKYIYYYTFPFCKIGIAEKGGAICNILINNDKSIKNLYDFVKSETQLIKKTAKELDEYFSGKRKVFDLPVTFHGTGFKVKVWESLHAIKYGETRSYKEVAALLGNPKASRAVGMANKRNPVPIIVPCHRVIGHDGSLVGYSGGLELKEKLLNLEKRFNRVRK